MPQLTKKPVCVMDGRTSAPTTTKITVERTNAHKIQPPLNPPPPSDLSNKLSFPTRRKTKTSGAGARLKRESIASYAKRSSRPATHLLEGKFDVVNGKNNSVEDEKSSGELVGRENERRITAAAVSARKLAAGLWRLHSPESKSNVGQSSEIQVHLEKDLLHTAHSLSAAKHGLHVNKFDPLFKIQNSAMEGATKWDLDGWKISTETKQIFDQPNALHHQTASISSLEAELEQAKGRINDLETERKSSKKKLEQFLRKLSEERAAWRSKEHEKIRAFIDDMKSGLSKERKNRQRLEMVNSKLVNELTDAKLSAKHYLHEYEKQRKAREVLEEVCDELAKEIGEDRAEVEALKSESMKLREEVDEERKMLQMAEVWREERVQMKLIDAKVMLEEKYSQMNALVENIESFLKSTGSALDLEEIKKVEFLRKVANSISMKDIRDLKYEPGNQDDIFAVFEDVNFGECNEWGSNVSHPEDEGSSYSTGSEKDGFSPQENWSSPDSGNQGISHGSAQKNSLKARLVEARKESRKIQLRQVLEQHI